MRIGELVQITDKEIKSLSPGDERRVGTLLSFSTFEGDCGVQRGASRPERIAEILWNTGDVGWILLSRIERVTMSTTA